MQSIGKEATALTDFFAAMNISHRGLHHKTYQGHVGKMVQACNAMASECKAASVSLIGELYAKFGNAPGNIDVTFDGTWLTRGRTSHISVGCIIEMYTGLVIDHVVLSYFYLGCLTGPKPDDEAYADWLTTHTPVCQKNIDCKAGQMEVEAALIMFRRSLEKYKLRYTTNAVRWRQQDFSCPGTGRCVRLHKSPEERLYQSCTQVDGSCPACSS